MESHESTRQRVEPSQSKLHEDHVAGKGFTSMSYYNLVHKFIPMPQARCKSSGGQGMEKARDNSSMEFGKFKSKTEVILEAERDKKKVHFATLMDISPELEP